MKRISHDLAGAAARMAKVREELESCSADVRESWTDAKADAYFKQNFAEAAPTMNHLISGLTRLVEAFETIASRVTDPDRN